MSDHKRKQCSKCGQDLGWTEGDPCDACWFKNYDLWHKFYCPDDHPELRDPITALGGSVEHS